MIVPTLDALMRVLIVTPLVYLAAVALLRVSGKRSLAKLNAFDLIVTVALGSVLAGTVTSSSTALLTGVTGFGLLLLLQIVVSWLTSRRRVDTTLVRSEPTLVMRRGEFLPDALAEVLEFYQTAVAPLRVAVAVSELTQWFHIVVRQQGEIRARLHELRGGNP